MKPKDNNKVEDKIIQIMASPSGSFGGSYSGISSRVYGLSESGRLYFLEYGSGNKQRWVKLVDSPTRDVKVL